MPKKTNGMDVFASDADWEMNEANSPSTVFHWGYYPFSKLDWSTGRVIQPGQQTVPGISAPTSIRSPYTSL